MMKFFLDTANIDEIRKAANMGVLDGVTTNPTLVARETGQGSFRKILEDICEVVNGPVNAEVVATEAEGMVKEARDLANLHSNIVVKIPMIPEGMKAVKRLAGEGIRTNVTLVFSPVQALIAAKAGASYVSPFVGRMDDIANGGMEVVSQIRTIFDNYGIETEILAASLRHPMHVVEAALIGADIATMPYKVFEQLFKHPLTDIGLKRFLDDWDKVKEQLLGKK
jgi:transaldolase